MKVGDLVKGRLSLGGRLGIILEVIVDDPINPERNTFLVRWKGGLLDKLNGRLLEVISERG